ncbi:hypothetical protein TESG_02204 [Trichophyton tonsurans CBS 112818]|uniref:Ubiquinol-cytochrome c chaperone domain-containing protein n=1 Tax=Trichophyton tonsurans (strain CBS 112818) TaxID=647933 RepID=F2RTP7_TRIT1|nr:hypothetical protein TESG_02204 [Trichophyton tonsurans CBS 112818]
MEMSRSRCWVQVGQAAKKQLAGRQQCRYAKKSLLGVASRGLSSSSRPIQPVRSSSISSSSGYGDGFIRRITAGDRIRTRISPSYMTKRDISDSDSTYISYGIADRLFTNCSKQADYSISKKLRKADQVPKAESGEEIGEGSGWWYEELGLLPTFSTWAQVTFLHMYLLTVRLRGLPTSEAFQVYNRYLFEHFSQAAERRMVEVHGITSRTVRVSYLKDLFVQWRGAIAAYDEGIVKGDAQLAAAVWRNLFKGLPTDHKGEELDWAKIAKVVLYMRRSLDNLAEFQTQEVIFAFIQGAGPDMFFNPAELSIFARKTQGTEESSSSSQGSPLGPPRT